MFEFSFKFVMLNDSISMKLIANKLFRLLPFGTFSQESHLNPTDEVENSSLIGEKKCEHDYRLNEQVGMVCRLCGFVETEIKDILPPFVSWF